MTFPRIDDKQVLAGHDHGLRRALRTGVAIHMAGFAELAIIRRVGTAAQCSLVRL